MSSSATAIANADHKVVSRREWVEARKAHLAAEKELTRMRDDVSRRRRELPWVRVDKEYVFETPAGRQTLANLFEGRSQLIVYHFMFGPDWAEGCPSCSYLADHFDGAVPHLNARDVTFVAASRAPLAEFEPFRRRMGWKFKWVSSAGSDFNFDYHVSFRPEELASDRAYYNYATGPAGVEELPGASVFYRDRSGGVFHTYSSYARGLDLLVGAYNFLDLTPKGRDEEGLAFAMAWVRHHDRYGAGYTVDPEAGYAPPAKRDTAACPHCDAEARA